MRTFSGAFLAFTGLGLGLCGCGTSLWVMTPRSDVTYEQVPRTTNVAVRTQPAGLTLLVDGAEAGQSPRAIPIEHKELRRHRKKAIWPAVIGTAIDVVAFTIMTMASGDEGGPGPALFVAGLGTGLLALDLNLINAHSSIEERVESFPVVTRIGVQTPFGNVEHTIRVPDVDHLDLDFQPQGWMMLPQQPQQAPGQVQGQTQGAIAVPSTPVDVVAPAQ